jgi:hypothetical protein
MDGNQDEWTNLAETRSISPHRDEQKFMHPVHHPFITTGMTPGDIA